jgi:hypothetical protein
MYLRDGIGRLLFRRNVFKRDLSLDGLELDGKVLGISMLGVVDNMMDRRLLISLENERIVVRHGEP